MVFMFDKHTFTTICMLSGELVIAVRRFCCVVVANNSLLASADCAIEGRSEFLDTAAGLQFGDNRSDKGQLNEI